MYHLFKASRKYEGKAYNGPTNGNVPAVYRTIQEALEAKVRLTKINPVGWDIYDATTQQKVWPIDN